MIFGVPWLECSAKWSGSELFNFACFLINPQVRWYWDFCGNTPQHFPRQNCSPRFLHSQNSCQSPETSHSQVPSHLQQNHFIFLFFFPSLSSISTLLSHPCQLNSYCRLKLRLIYWEEKRCTIAQIRSSIDAFAISFPLSASAQPAKLSQSSLRSTLAEEETSNPTTTDWRKTGVGSFNVEKHYWLAFCHKMGCEGNTEGKFNHLPNILQRKSCFLEMFLSLFRNRCSHFLGGFQHFPKRSIFPLQRAGSAGLVAGYVRFSLSFIITIFVIKVSLHLFCSQTLTSIITSNENDCQGATPVETLHCLLDPSSGCDRPLGWTSHILLRLVEMVMVEMVVRV